MILGLVRRQRELQMLDGRTLKNKVKEEDLENITLKTLFKMKW